MKLIPKGTTYEIAYEDIINSKTTSGTVGGSNTESTGSGSSQSSDGISEEEFKKVVERLSALEEKEKTNSLNIDTLSKNMPVFHSIDSEGTKITGVQNAPVDTGATCTIPANSYYVISSGGYGNYAHSAVLQLVYVSNYNVFAQITNRRGRCLFH